MEQDSHGRLAHLLFAELGNAGVERQAYGPKKLSAVSREHFPLVRPHPERGVGAGGCELMGDAVAMLQ
jgi:hypothetical protein